MGWLTRKKVRREVRQIRKLFSCKDRTRVCNKKTVLGFVIGSFERIKNDRENSRGRFVFEELFLDLEHRVNVNGDAVKRSDDRSDFVWHLSPRANEMLCSIAIACLREGIELVAKTV